MILNPVRLVRCILIDRDLTRKLAARKDARANGRVYVSPYTRSKA